MTDKEFKRLSRSQLIDIIYQLQLKQDELTADNEKLSSALADKRLRVSKAGNIAEAALEIHNVMQAAQNAATHYLEEIQLRTDNEYQRIMKESNDEAAAIIEKAQKEEDEDLKSFTEYIKKDKAAVQMACTTNYSNGVMEGTVNKIKEIKRTMFNRAGIELLRAKVIYANYGNVFT